MDKIHIKEISVLGEIAAGNSVVPFVPRGNKTINIPVRENHYDLQLDSLEVRGDSLSGSGIRDGCFLTFRPCSVWEIRPEKVYVVYIETTGELIARHVRINDDETITLVPANPDFVEKTYDFEEIEIRGLVLYYTYDAP